MKPLLKWAGGKRHIAHTLKKYLPDNQLTGTYFEPFIGGAAFFLELLPASAVVADINANLIRFYNDVKNNCEDLEAEVLNIVREFDALDEVDQLNYYLTLRQNFNSERGTLRASAQMYALNKLCFNGLYRENSKGEFNVPFGKKRRFPDFELEQFKEVSTALKNVEVKVSDFEETVSSAQPGDFVYFDPPYVPLELKPSFTAYNAAGFGFSEHQRLAKTMLNLRENGIKAMLSNSASLQTAEIYSELHIHSIVAPRMVSAKGSGRGMIEEYLILNYEINEESLSIN